MAGLREQKKAETRKAIITAAIQLFSEKGFDKTSIEDIARVAGIGKATVYTYFSAKSDIFMYYCDDELEEAFSNLKKTRHENVSLLDQLIEFFLLKFNFVTHNHEFGRQLLQEMVFPREVNEKAKEHNQRYFDFLEELFLAAQQRGVLADNQDLFLLSVHFYSLYLGVLAGWYGGYAETTEEIESAMRTLFSQVLEGVAR
ncbi:TetR/AcrR family transcriptional regulator [Malonomonas rubra]|uniref:TetR/AcrR family transcriptional regulator n=1 Tax=Malonomonas rubra TaxID=57040 RepID=UPI0026F108E5|nr:TetR/AcrR family transcriptional regulator [Malonomonas rubra]